MWTIKAVPYLHYDRGDMYLIRVRPWTVDFFPRDCLGSIYRYSTIPYSLLVLESLGDNCLRSYSIYDCEHKSSSIFSSYSFRAQPSHPSFLRTLCTIVHSIMLRCVKWSIPLQLCRLRQSLEKVCLPFCLDRTDRSKTDAAQHGFYPHYRECLSVCFWR